MPTRWAPRRPLRLSAFIHDVFRTSAGQTMIVLGIGVGFLFALAAMMISVVSFPLLLDQDVGLDTAVSTSVKAVISNPAPMAVWGLTVAGLWCWAPFRPLSALWWWCRCWVTRPGIFTASWWCRVRRRCLESSKAFRSCGRSGGCRPAATPAACPRRDNSHRHWGCGRPPPEAARPCRCD